MYLPTGDIEEVTRKSWESALIHSGSNAYTYQQVDQPAPVSPTSTYDGLDTTDVEDVTNLSDGNLVPENALSGPVDNAVVEGSDAVYDEETDIDPKDVLTVIRELGLKDVSASQVADIVSVMRAVKTI